METILRLYFKSYSHRLRIIYHVAYLLVCLLITNYIMNKINYYYTFPTSISIATVLAFLLKGEWLLPFMAYTLYAWWSYLVVNLIGWGIYKLLKKIKIFKSENVQSGLRRYIVKNKWVKDEEGKLVKGRYYKGFKSTVKVFYKDDFNQTEVIRILNALLFGILITVWLTPIGLPKWVLYFTIGYYVFFAIGSLCLYSIVDEQEYIEDIINEIDKLEPEPKTEK